MYMYILNRNITRFIYNICNIYIYIYIIYIYIYILYHNMSYNIKKYYPTIKGEIGYQCLFTFIYIIQNISIHGIRSR